MNLRALDNYYLKQPEPLRSTLLVLKDLILDYHPDISPEWKYGMPFFYFRKKMFCYFWHDKKSGEPYIGFMNGNKMPHPKLVAGKRARVRAYHFDAQTDLPIHEIQVLLAQAIEVA